MRPAANGKQSGVLGLGKTGSRIVRRAAAFDMRVSYHSGRPQADAPWPYVPTLLELARGSDVLMVATPSGGAETRHFVNGEVLAAREPGGEQIRANKLRAMAVSSLGRSRAVPEVPTMVELGFPGFDASSWFGMVAPARTPRR